MNIKNSFDQYILFQKNTLDFLENANDIEEKYQVLIDQIKDQKMCDDKHQVRSVMHFIVQVANNHNHESNLYYKIKKIIIIFKDEIKKYFYNFEIFNIFKYNKMILLFLIDEKLLDIDIYFIKNILKEKKQYMRYVSYFTPEIMSFIKSHPDESYLIQKLKKQLKNIPVEFDHNRRIGENHNYICQLIREDLIEEFIIHVQKNSISLNSLIKYSIFETNLFLIQSDQEVTLIEYAAFFGSIQIFKYLYKNGCELTSSLWLYSIHGNNPEIIHFLEEQKVAPVDTTYEECLIEAIKCHHNDIANYIMQNYIQRDFQTMKETTICVQYYNFFFVEFIAIFFQFYYLSKYDYALFLEYIKDCEMVNSIQIFYYKNPSENYDKSDGKYIIKAAKTGVIDIDESSEYKKKRTPLIIAIEKENIEIVKCLLSYEKIDANVSKIINADGFMISFNVQEPPLFVALAKENIEIIKILLSSDKINPNLLKIKNMDGSRDGELVSLLYETIEKNNIEVFKILLDSEKVDPNIYSYVKTCKHYSTGITPLHYAVEKEKIDFVKILLESEKVDPNIYTIEGIFSDDYCLYQTTRLLNIKKRETALHIAVQKGNIDIVKLLLSNSKINPKNADWRWNTPASLINNNQEMKLLFENFI